jgi:Carbohydrate esterase, sialic acid-specific acetylesterase
MSSNTHTIMIKLSKSLSLLLMLLLLTGVHARTWTSSDETKTFEGELESYVPETGMVVVKQTTGKKSNLTFHQDKLSAADIAFLKEHGPKKQGAKDVGKNAIKVFILAGQSNMEGQGLVAMDDAQNYNGGKGNLVWSMANSKSAEKMKKLKKDDQWVVRDDVQISFKVNEDVRKGGLTIGYTGYGGNTHIGPELSFGFVMGDHFEQPVLLIKTAWGGKSLFVDFRPPSSGGQVGPFYTKMVEEIRAALAALGEQKYELAGFYWQQGWNDMCEPLAIPEYADNLVNLVKDLRKEFNVPDMPVVVGELGNGGPATEGGMFEFRKAQESGTRKIKNAVFVHTTDFARPEQLSPCPTHGHHWFANAESYFLIGDAAGEAMKRLIK